MAWPGFTNKITDVNYMPRFDPNYRAHLQAELDEIPAYTDSEIAKITKYPGCKAFNSTSISVSNSTYNTLPLNSEEYDTDNMHDNTVINSRITCNTAGVYIVTGSILWDTNGVGLRTLSLRKNSVIPIMETDIPSIVGYALGQEASALVKLNVGDYVELFAWQNTGGALSLSNAVLSLAKVG